MSGETIRVYKFYSRYFGLDALERRRLKISTISDINDPFEFQSFTLPDPMYRLSWEKARIQLAKEMGLISFCMSWKNPVVWSHYADNHSGIALGFDISKGAGGPIDYSQNRKKLPRLLEIEPAKAIEAIVNAIMTKFDHWSYEQEYRVIVPLKKRCLKTGLYFTAFDSFLDLKEVILGPLCELKIEEVRDFLELHDVNIRKTRLAVNSFKVVRA